MKWISAYATFLACMLVTTSVSYHSAGVRRGNFLTKFTSRNHRVNSRVLKMNAKLFEFQPEDIKIAGQILKSGGLVAFPTETVYGLGANALIDSSVKAIFTAKKRPATDPLIVHVISKEAMYELFDFSHDNLILEGGRGTASLICETLAYAFWPGPLTIIHKAKDIVPLSVTSGTGFVGIRSPRHIVARQLLEAAGVPVAAPSANRFGHVSPTTAEHVYADLGEEDIVILKDNILLSGGCDIGIESTVCNVSLDGKVITILRCGAVTSSDIAQALLEAGNCSEHLQTKDFLTSVSVIVENEKFLGNETPKNDSLERLEMVDEIQLLLGEGKEMPVAPGQMIKHYAPDIPTYIVAADSLQLTTYAEVDSIGFSIISNNIPTDGNLKGTIDVELSQSFVIDFGGMMIRLKDKAAYYRDLSSVGSIEEACRAIFRILREAEDVAASIDSKITQQPSDSSQPFVVVKSVLLPDLRHPSETSQLTRALWERLHRAASGTFVY